MALVPPLDATPAEVRALLAPLRGDFSIAIHSLGNAFAVGAIIRVAHSFLAREIFVVGDRAVLRKGIDGDGEVRDDRFGRWRRRSLRARERATGVGDREGSRASIALRGRAISASVVFLFGSERAGLSREVIGAPTTSSGSRCTALNHSFPVTVAAGIVMSEWARRRFVQGATL